MPSTDTIYFRIDKVKPSKNEIDFALADNSNTGYYFKKKLNPDGDLEYVVYQQQFGCVFLKVYND